MGRGNPLLFSSSPFVNRRNLSNKQKKEAEATVARVGAWLPRLHSLVIGPGLGRHSAMLAAVESILSLVQVVCLFVCLLRCGLFLMLMSLLVVWCY